MPDLPEAEHHRLSVAEHDQLEAKRAAADLGEGADEAARVEQSHHAAFLDEVRARELAALDDLAAGR